LNKRAELEMKTADNQKYDNEGMIDGIFQGVKTTRLQMSFIERNRTGVRN
jgi:hypothetical protein